MIPERLLLQIAKHPQYSRDNLLKKLFRQNFCGLILSMMSTFNNEKFEIHIEMHVT